MLCSPFGAKAWSQQTQTSAMPLTRPRVSKIQHCVTYHPPRCQGMQANGSIEQRRFCRTRHEKPTRATGPIFRATHTRARLVLVLVLVQVPSPKSQSRHFASFRAALLLPKAKITSDCAVRDHDRRTAHPDKILIFDQRTIR